MDPLHCSALGDHPGPAVRQVEIADIKVQDLGGPGGGLVQQAPKGLFPQGDVRATPNSLEHHVGNRLSLVNNAAPTLDRLRRIGHHPALTAAVAAETLDRGQVAVPGRWRDTWICRAEKGLGGSGVQAPRGEAGAKGRLEAAEGQGVYPPGGRGKGALGQEGGRSLREGD